MVRDDDSRPYIQGAIYVYWKGNLYGRSSFLGSRRKRRPEAPNFVSSTSLKSLPPCHILDEVSLESIWLSVRVAGSRGQAAACQLRISPVRWWWWSRWQQAQWFPRRGFAQTDSFLIICFAAPVSMETKHLKCSAKPDAPFCPQRGVAKMGLMAQAGHLCIDVTLRHILRMGLSLHCWTLIVWGQIF